MSSEKRKLIAGISIFVAGVLLIAAILIFGASFLSLRDEAAIRLWLSGSAVLGLLTGLTTGLSEKPGSGTEFVKFIGAGLLVPILGGAAALISKTEVVTELSTYAGDLVIEKITTTSTSFEETLHPLAVSGSFFIVFGFFALLGIFGGALIREGGGPVIKAD